MSPVLFWPMVWLKQESAYPVMHDSTFVSKVVMHDFSYNLGSLEASGSCVHLCCPRCGLHVRMRGLDLDVAWVVACSWQQLGRPLRRLCETFYAQDSAHAGRSAPHTCTGEVFQSSYFSKRCNSMRVTGTQMTGRPGRHMSSYCLCACMKLTVKQA